MPTTISMFTITSFRNDNFAWTCREWDGIVWRSCEPVTVGNTKVIADPTIWYKWTDGKYSLFPIITSSLMWISNCGHVFRVGGVRSTSDWSVFECCWWKRSDIIVKKHLIGQTVIVPYIGKYRQRYTRATVNFDINVLMWISNRKHVLRIGGIILHPTSLFSNVLLQKKRHESRTTSDLSKSDCSVHDRWRPRYHVHY